MSQENEDTKTITGIVKWFDPGKGFGFVVSDEGGPDILLHANVLRNFGQSSVADQAIVEIVVQKTERGFQTVEILHIDAPEGAIPEGVDEYSDYDLDDAGELEPARVKWFDKAKGFGFANVFGSPDDVFIHVEVLRRSGLADLQAGEAICVRVIAGYRGQMAALVSAWDTSFQDEK